jgi:hypothetical protein
MAKRKCPKGCKRATRKSSKKKHCKFGVSKTTGKCLKAKRRRR